jgi:hypothetical protein
MDRKAGHPFLTEHLTATHPSRTTDDDTGEAAPVWAPRYSRRLSDKILNAFHHACDQGELKVADQLVQILELMHKRPRPPGDRRRNAESLVAAHMRLWNLRHPGDR